MTPKFLKRTIPALSLLVALLGAPSAFSQGAAIKLAAVDMEKVFNEYWKTKKASKELDDVKAGYQKEIEAARADGRKKEDDLRKLFEEKDNPAYTDAKKAEIQKEIERRTIDLRSAKVNFEEMSGARAKTVVETMMKQRGALVDEIYKAIQKKAEKEAYTLVFDKTGKLETKLPAFLYVNPSLDITDDIIASLNAGAPAGSATSSDTKKDKPK